MDIPLLASSAVELLKPYLGVLLTAGAGAVGKDVWAGAKDLWKKVEPKIEPKIENKIEPAVEQKAEVEPKLEPKLEPAPAKAAFDNLEEEMANLLGRPPGKT